VQLRARRAVRLRPRHGVRQLARPWLHRRASGRLELVRSLVLLGLLVTLAAGASWLRQHHRPREAI
jgi:hypothetical protein